MSADMLLLTLHLCALGLFPAPQDSPAAVEGPTVELTSREGKTIAGDLVPAADGRFGLNAKDFLETLEIDLEQISRLDFRAAEGGAPATGEAIAVELACGDSLRGELRSLSESSWLLDVDGVGLVELAAERILGAEILGVPALVFNGPRGILGWSQSKRDKCWEALEGRLVSAAPGTAIGRDLGLEAERDMRFELAWKGEPRFRVALFSKSPKKILKRAIVIEVWGETLVAWSAEGESLGLVELVGGLAPDGRVEVHLRSGSGGVVFLDREGHELGRLARPPHSGPNIVFVNDGESLELRSLLVLDGAAELRRLRGEDVLGFDAETRSFITPEGLISNHEVLAIDFERPGTAVEATPGAIELVYLDGRRLSGRFVRMGLAGIEIEPLWSAHSVTASLAGLATIRVAEQRTTGRRKSAKSFLVAASGELGGELESIDSEGAIVWKPDIAVGSATLDRATVSRVVLNRQSAYFVSSRKWPQRLTLRSGDSFRCRLESIDGEVARLETPFGGSITIGLELIKAVEFNGRSMERFFKLMDEQPKQTNTWGVPFEPRRETSEGFDAASLERALALPRKYKRRAFEHLILARTGDFLRTKVVAWSPAGILYRGPLAEERLIPEQRLAALIWLDTAGAEPAQLPDPLPAERARIVLDEQTQLILDLSRVEDDKLYGTSSLLGELSIRLSDILSIELDPKRLTAPTPFDDWDLHPMKEPFPDEATGTPSTATIQVGASAPATKGEDLEGLGLDLADFHGSVVLLDFWAHW